MSELADRRAKYFRQPQVMAAWAAVPGDFRLEAIGVGDEQFARLQETVMRARLAFNQTLKGDREALAALIGPENAGRFLELEAMRAEQREHFPNRVAIWLRCAALISKRTASGAKNSLAVRLACISPRWVCTFEASK